MWGHIKKEGDPVDANKILKIVLAVFSLTLSSMLLLWASPLSKVVYESKLANLVLIVSFVIFGAAVAVYTHYRNGTNHKDWRSYTLMLAVYTYAFFFLIQAIEPYLPFFKSRNVMDIVPVWGFFTGSFVFFILLILPKKQLDNVYKHFFTVVLGVTAYLFGFLALFFIPSVNSFLLAGIPVILAMNALIFLALLRFLVQGTKKGDGRGYTMFFAVAFSILALEPLSPFLYQQWTILWWYCFVLDLIGFTFLLFGFLKKEKEEGEIDEILEIRFSHSKIGTKFMIYVATIFLVTISVVVYFFFDLRAQQIKDAIKSKELQMALIENNVSNKFETYFDDIEKVSSIDELSVLVRAFDAENGVDPITGEDIDEAKDQLALVFLGIVRAKPFYNKVRYIDAQGDEIVYVNSRLKNPYRVPEEGLVNRSDREFFKETLKLRNGKTYVAPVELNIEKDLLESYERPTMRFSRPVYNEQGMLRGVVVINLDARDFMETVRSHKSSGSEGNLYLLDQDGHYLVNPVNSTNEYWRAQLGSNVIYEYFDMFGHFISENVTKHHGDVLEGDSVDIHKSDSEPSLEKNEKTENSLTEKYILTHAVINYSKYDPNSFFVLVEETPERYVLGAVQKRFGQNIALLSFILFLIFTIMYNTLVRSVVGRIVINASVVKKLKEGDFSARAEIRGEDEVTEVARGINALAWELENREKDREEREKELQERTQKAEKASSSLEQTKLATLNILEDLDEEKKKVEEKVEERTKQLQEEKGKLGHVTQHMTTGVIFLNEKGEVLVANESIRNILGFRGENNQDILTALQDKFKDIKFKEKLGVCSVAGDSADPIEVEVDGKIYNIAVRCEETKLHDDTNTDREGEDLHGVFVWVEDVTRDRLIERSKSELVATASHQLRTPLTIARGNVEMLLDEDFGPLNDKQKEMMKDTSDSIIRLITMVNDMLDITKIEKGNLEFVMETFPLEEAIGPVIHRLEEYAQRHDFHIIYNKPEEDIIVVADKEHLQQVFQNLIDNAIRYSRQPGKVEITLDKKDDHVDISVKDNGIGIPEVERSNIFGRFYRASNAVRFASGGSGLGLFIVKSFIEQMKGTISLESKENEGTKFTITLPLQKTET